MSSRIEPVGLPEAVLAHVPEALRSYREVQETIVENGILDSRIKELCARYLAEDDEVVVHHDDAKRFDERERAALAWAHAVGWNAEGADDALWERLHAHFSEAELVELGYSMHTALGLQHFLRTLGIRAAR